MTYLRLLFAFLAGAYMVMAWVDCIECIKPWRRKAVYSALWMGAAVFAGWPV